MASFQTPKDSTSSLDPFLKAQQCLGTQWRVCSQADPQLHPLPHLASCLGCAGCVTTASSIMLPQTSSSFSSPVRSRLHFQIVSPKNALFPQQFAWRILCKVLLSAVFFLTCTHNTSDLVTFPPNARSETDPCDLENISRPARETAQRLSTPAGCEVGSQSPQCAHSRL